MPNFNKLEIKNEYKFRRKNKNLYNIKLIS